MIERGAELHLRGEMSCNGTWNLQGTIQVSSSIVLSSFRAFWFLVFTANPLKFVTTCLWREQAIAIAPSARLLFVSAVQEPCEGNKSTLAAWHLTGKHQVGEPAWSKQIDNPFHANSCLITSRDEKVVLVLEEDSLLHHITHRPVFF